MAIIGYGSARNEGIKHHGIMVVRLLLLLLVQLVRKINLQWIVPVLFIDPKSSTVIQRLELEQQFHPTFGIVLQTVHWHNETMNDDDDYMLLRGTGKNQLLGLIKSHAKRWCSLILHLFKKATRQSTRLLFVTRLA